MRIKTSLLIVCAVGLAQAGTKKMTVEDSLAREENAFAPKEEGSSTAHMAKPQRAVPDMRFAISSSLAP